ncbi:MAG: FMN-binding protein [Spirochaetia bacterium]
MTKKQTIRFILLITGTLLLILSFSSCMSASEVTDYFNSIADPDFARLADGRYYGEYTVDMPFGVIAMNSTVAVNLVITENRLERIEYVIPEGYREEEVFLAMADRVVEAQSIEVDGVSGATVSNTAFFKAVEVAASGSGE